MLAGRDSGRSEALLVTARSLAVDAVTGEVVTALHADGVRPILLKGPVFADWLYDDGAVRSYMDSDLLVAPAAFGTAREALVRLGFKHSPGSESSDHAERWTRGSDGAEVDLHKTLFGVGVAPEEVWRNVVGGAEWRSFGGTTVQALPEDARALVVALHAAQHGPGHPKIAEDLRRALQRAGPDTWAAAADLAARLDAQHTFATGLRLLPEGVSLASRLDLIGPDVIELGLGSRPTVALGIDRVARRSGLWRKLALIGRELFPSRAYLRWWSPLARRGRAGLALAYLWRPLWLLWHVGPSFVAWRRSRRSGGRPA